jgi:hypothetical protein
VACRSERGCSDEADSENKGCASERGEQLFPRVSVPGDVLLDCLPLGPLLCHSGGQGTKVFDGDR